MRRYHNATAQDPGLPQLSKVQLWDIRQRLYVMHGPLGPFGALLAIDEVEDIHISRGFRVIARSWPGMDGDINELRRDPSGIEHLGIGEIVDYHETMICELDAPPIIIGHSFGGAFTEMLLDCGLGAAGVAIDAAAVRGILRLPLLAAESRVPGAQGSLQHP